MLEEWTKEMIGLIGPEDMDQKRPDRLLRQQMNTQRRLDSFSSTIEQDHNEDMGRSP